MPAHCTDLLLGDEPLQNVMAEYRGLTASHSSVAWLWLCFVLPGLMQPLSAGSAGLGQLGVDLLGFSILTHF